MNTIKLNTTGTNVKMIAHRGLSGLEAENTCAAFVAAGNREKYFGIECDIHRFFCRLAKQSDCPGSVEV